MERLNPSRPRIVMNRSQQLHRGAATARAVRFRPCIDIHKGKVKQIVGSTLLDSSQSALVVNFESEKSASEFANMYREDNLPGGHAIMLGADALSVKAAFEALQAYPGEVSLGFPLISHDSELPGGLQIGGGVNLDNATAYLDAGASHVIVTSFVFTDGKLEKERLQQLVRLVGKNRLVLDLSCRNKDGKYMVVTDRWQKFSDLSVTEEALADLAESCDEFLVHGVDVEGKRLGIDEDLVELLGKWSPIPVTYAGGVTSMEDLERIKVAGGGFVDVTVGSALDIFGGNMAYSDVVKWHQESQSIL